MGQSRRLFAEYLEKQKKRQSEDESGKPVYDPALSESERKIVDRACERELEAEESTLP